MSFWNPHRECENCGEPTDQKAGRNCDECTGILREFCEECGRSDLKGVESITTHRIAPRHKNPEGGWCFGSSTILAVRN